MRKNNLVAAITVFGFIAFMISSCSEAPKSTDLKQKVSNDISFSQPGNDYYEELPDPAPDNSDDNNFGDFNKWSQIKKDVSVSFASSNTRFAKSQIPQISFQESLSLKAWKGEKVNAQILVWTKTEIPRLDVELGNLVSADGKTIEAGNLKTGFVRYVMTNPGFGELGNYYAMAADPIDIIETIPVKKNTVQPIWLTISVPAESEAGTYTGKINVIADKNYTLEVTVSVLNHVLPPAAEWKYDLDLWQHPASIARVHGVALWSDEHFRLMKLYYTILADAGQKTITTTILEEAWGHQTYDDFPSLIKWTKRKDQSWSYDYSVFDKYVSFVMSCGINKRINCYSLVPWNKFQYYDEALGRDSVFQAVPGSEEHNLFLSTMLTDFTSHLKAKGWFDITTIAMDERPVEAMLSIISLIRKVDPAWKVSLAGNYHPEIEKDLYDYCLYIGSVFPEKELRSRIEQGKPSTFYTCCSPDFPNGFTWSPPAEHVWFGWYAGNAGFTGYLRWAYNSWPANPLRDSRFPKHPFPGGDTYQIYPGPRTSIRFEKLIEGIQDNEKIRIIRELYSKNTTDEKYKNLEAVIKTFTYQKNMKVFPSDSMVVKAQGILNEL